MPWSCGISLRPCASALKVLLIEFLPISWPTSLDRTKKAMIYRHFQDFHVGQQLDHLADMMINIKPKKR